MNCLLGKRFGDAVDRANFTGFADILVNGLEPIVDALDERREIVLGDAGLSCDIGQNPSLALAHGLVEKVATEVDAFSLDRALEGAHDGAVVGDGRAREVEDDGVDPHGERIKHNDEGDTIEQRRR